MKSLKKLAAFILMSANGIGANRCFYSRPRIDLIQNRFAFEIQMVIVKAIMRIGVILKFKRNVIRMGISKFGRC